MLVITLQVKHGLKISPHTILTLSYVNPSLGMIVATLVKIAVDLLETSSNHSRPVWMQSINYPRTN